MFNQLLPPIYRRLRRRAGLSQGRLAAILGVCRTTVYKWESGKARPDPEQEKRLIELCRCTQAELAEILCGQMSELLDKQVTIGEGGDGDRPSMAQARARALARKLAARGAGGLPRALNNQIQATELLGLAAERSLRDLGDLVAVCLEAGEKKAQ